MKSKKHTANWQKIPSGFESGDKAAEAKFKEANEAYEVLSDSEKKARYDQFGHAGVDPNYGAGGPGGAGGFDFDFGDIFSSFFGGSGFGGFGTGRSNPNAPQRGSIIRRASPSLLRRPQRAANARLKQCVWRPAMHAQAPAPRKAPPPDLPGM